MEPKLIEHLFREPEGNGHSLEDARPGRHRRGKRYRGGDMRAVMTISVIASSC
jgi:hypothetical protein